MQIAKCPFLDLYFISFNMRSYQVESKHAIVLVFSFFPFQFVHVVPIHEYWSVDLKHWNSNHFFFLFQRFMLNYFLTCRTLWIILPKWNLFLSIQIANVYEDSFYTTHPFFFHKANQLTLANAICVCKVQDFFWSKSIIASW